MLDSPMPQLVNVIGKFSREIQKSQGRWHMPANDRRAWLCLSIRPDDYSTQAQNNAVEK